MSRDLFQHMCSEIEDLVGERCFKREEYLHQLLEFENDPKINIVLAHQQSTGGYVSGEAKLAITLRVLGGGSYMDMALIFGISFNHAHKIVNYTVDNWLMHPRFYPIDGIKYCSDDIQLQEVANQFCDASQGVMSGCIGALDGWVVKIKAPSRRDGVHDPASFYSRKGYYALNVQAIVDKKKRVLYRSILSRGAEHDSTAFKNSSLYQWLIHNWNSLRQKGYYFIGDSAYSIRSFLHTPYDNALHETPEDNYNFFHSSSRICVECAFGEIDLRFGIFWRALTFGLAQNIKIIECCMRLHNMIVMKRGDTGSIDAIDREVFQDDARRVFYNSNDYNEGVEGGESDVRRDANGDVFRGRRPTRRDHHLAEVGKAWRDEHRDEISRQRLVRPATNWYREHNRIITYN